jgi:hypothetical protein
MGCGRPHRPAFRLRRRLYDPVQIQQGLEGSGVQLLVRLRSGWRFYANPEGPRLQPVVRVVTERSSAAAIQRRGPSLPASISRRASTTARCVLDAGRNCIPKCACTKAAAAADRCPLSGVRLCWWRLEGCRVERDAASRRSCGCGGMVLRQPRRISTSSGESTFAGSIWSTLFASSNRLWGGPPPECDIPSRPTAGAGWYSSPTPPVI